MQASRLKLVKQALFAFGVLLTVVIAGGCASPVPGQAGSSGKAILVTMQFNAQMYPELYYYFVINYAKNADGSDGPGNQYARGPIPVLDQATPEGGVGNGFATYANTPGVTANDYGMTDYIVYHSGQATSSTEIGIYHLPANNDPNSLGGPLPGALEGQPSQFTLPENSSDPATLTFLLPLSALAVDPATGSHYDQNTTTRIVNSMHWLQVNLIATDKVPVAQIDPNKNTDSFGDTRTTHDQSSWLVIDVSGHNTYKSTDATSSFSLEPIGDVWPCGNCNPSIDIIYWKIEVVNTGG